MKRAYFYILSFILLVSIGGCKKSAQSGLDTKHRVKRVAIATLMTHPALDSIIANMKTDLAEHGYQDGETIQYVIKNANGDSNVAVTLVRELELSKPDVLVAITTPVAQVAVKEARSPIVFSAVTDPVGAGVVASLTSPPANVTGVSDAWPYLAQLALAKEIVPEAKRLGVVFNPGEAASQYGIKQIREMAPSVGFELIEVPVSSTEEILGALRVRIRGLDAVYLSSDNTVIQGLPAALKVCFDNKKPLFVGDSGTVEKGGLAAVSVGYAGVGRLSGDLVARVLNGERGIPIVVAKGDEIFLNLDTAKRLGINFSPALRARATQVFGQP